MIKREGRISENTALQIFLEKTDLNAVREAILQSESRFHFILSDLSFDEFVIQLAVLTERLQRGCSIEMDAKSNQEERQLSDSRERKEWFVIQYLKSQLTDRMGIVIPEAEERYLRICLQALRYQVPMSSSCS